MLMNWILIYLRKPSSLTPASEKTSTNKLPALGAAAVTGGPVRSPNRSADGDGVD